MYNNDDKYREQLAYDKFMANATRQGVTLGAIIDTVSSTGGGWINISLDRQRALLTVKFDNRPEILKLRPGYDVTFGHRAQMWRVEDEE